MADTVVITGGSSGLGLSLAHRLRAKGASVVLIARDPEKLEAARHEVARVQAPDDAEVAAFSCDVTNAQAVADVFDRVAVEVGTPDTLICSAGVLHEERFDRMPLELVRQTMEINYFGVVYTVRAALDHLKKGARPRILVIASVAAEMGVYGYAAYSASKHALHGWTESLFYELRSEGIRVQIALPPEFESPMVEKLNVGRSAENRAMVSAVPTMTGDQAADAVMAGLEGSDFEIIPSAAARFVVRSHRWFPNLTRRVSSRRVRAARRASPKG